MTVHQIRERVTKPARKPHGIDGWAALSRGLTADWVTKPARKPAGNRQPGSQISRADRGLGDEAGAKNRTSNGRAARCRAPPYCTRPPVPRSRGSSTSRRASPSMLKPNTASEMAAPGPDRHPRRGVEERAARPRQHGAPRRIGRRHAEAEERQRRLGEDRAAEADGGQDDDRWRPRWAGCSGA